METFDIIDRIIAMIFTLGGLTAAVAILYVIYYIANYLYPETIAKIKKWCIEP